MAKTGWKSGGSNGGAATKRSQTNRLPPKSNVSSKLTAGRRRDKDPAKKNSQHQRSAETIQRLKMYTSGKAIRNRHGKVVGGAFQMSNRAGDRAIDSSTGRIQPDRRWFGNTRTVKPTDLDRFRQEMTEATADPYSVVLKRKKLPIGLLQDAAEYNLDKKSKTAALLDQEPFEHAFGKQSRRKRVKLDQYFIAREHGQDSTNSGASKETLNYQPTVGGKTEILTNANNNEASIEANGEDASREDDDDVKNQQAVYLTLLSAAKKSQDLYEEINNREGIVPWGRDSNIKRTEGEGVDWRPLRKDDLFLKGQSKRIWNEFYKVIDCSDVILHVIDARNVPGTRCTMIEKHVANNAPHKHLVFVLNKIDLVPNWVAKRWMGELAQYRPTIAFHASMTHAFGKGALISLLRQFGKLHEDKKQISVGVIGYPNVGKSSVINTLISKKSCKVAPVPGETKIWQYITLFKRIALIDCPGVVVDTAGDTEIDSVLKGVVRAERLENPEDFVDAIQEHVKAEHIAAHYNIPNKKWDDSNELMETIARKFGRLRKGGDPCLRSAAVMLINDFQRGRLPHYVAPPELKEVAQTKDGAVTNNTGATQDTKNFPVVKQDLSAIGEEHMKKGGVDEAEEYIEQSAEGTEDDGDEDDEDEDETDGGDKSGPPAAENQTESGDIEQDHSTTASTPAPKERSDAVPASQGWIGDGEWDD